MASTTSDKNRWIREKLDRIYLMVPKGSKETIQSHAVSHSESLNAFIKRAIRETMERDLEENERKEKIAQIVEKSGKSIEEIEAEELETTVLDYLEQKVHGIRARYFDMKRLQQLSNNDTSHIDVLGPGRTRKSDEPPK